MLSYLQLLVIKESLDGHDIIYLNIDNKEFVFRTLGVKEYHNITLCVDGEKDLEDAICQATLVYPQDYTFSTSPFAGIPSIAADYIKQASGIDNADYIFDSIDEKRIENGRFFNQCLILIKAAFPEFNFLEIEDWPWSKIIDYAVKAETIINMKGGDVSIVDRRMVEEQEETEELSMKELGAELRKNGIDPMLHFTNKYINNEKEIVDFPLIGGIHWDKERVLNEIRGQMEKGRK